MATAKKATRGSRAGSAVPKEPSAAARDAAAEEQVPLEPVGPGVEHEDHEGGLTDSLAKKGVRAPLPTAEEKEEAAEEEEAIIRAPSVRERQTGLRAAVTQGGMRGRRATLASDASPKEQKEYAEQLAVDRGIKPGSTIVPVIATRLGQYPADGRLRAPGEAFDYVMGPDEKKLPSWVRDATGAIESRGQGERSTEENAVTATIQVRKDGTAEII